MNDALRTVSPGDTHQTVGKSPKSLQTRERVQNIGKDTNFSLASMWAAFQNASPPSAANPSKPLTNLHIACYGSYSSSSISLTESKLCIAASGTVVQTLDYYPYGATRINSSAGGVDTKKKFAGMERDTASGLDYAMARYYDNARGQFLSEDPVFWEIGLTPDGRAILSDPQLQNSYSWGRDNPITKKDPDGRCPWCLPFLIGGAAGGLSQYAGDIMANRAAGITGMAAYTPSSSWQEYNAAVAAGSVTGAVATAGLIYGGVAATLGSGAQDWAGGNQINPGKAVINGIATVATGGFFKWGAGASPAEIYMQATGRSFSSLPSNIFRNELRYSVANDVWGGSVSAVIQSRYQSVQSINASTGASTGGGGSMPSNSSLWVTPSGAVVTFGGSLVVGPVAQSTPATIKR